MISQLRAAWFNSRDVNNFTSGVARGGQWGMSPLNFPGGAEKKREVLQKRGKGRQKRGRNGEKNGQNSRKGGKEERGKWGKFG